MAICRLRPLLSAVLVMLALGPMAAFAQDPEPAGETTRIQGEVWVERTDGRHDLAVGDQIMIDDTLVTGQSARLMVTLRDTTQLTMGSNGRIVVDALIAPPDGSVADKALTVLSGAFHIIAPTTRGAQVVTPVATIGIRGTEFWGGSLDSALDVLLFEGVVEVTNPQGRSILEAPLQGLGVPDADSPPGRATTWSANKLFRAAVMVAFDE